MTYHNDCYNLRNCPSSTGASKVVTYCIVVRLSHRGCVGELCQGSLRLSAAAATAAVQVQTPLLNVTNEKNKPTNVQMKLGHYG